MCERKGWSLASVQIDWPQHGRCVIADSPTLLLQHNKDGRPCFFTKGTLTFTVVSLFRFLTNKTRIKSVSASILFVKPSSVL